MNIKLNKGWYVSVNDGDKTQNVLCELWTVWSEKIVVNCGGGMMCVCAVKWCFWHYHAKAQLNNSEAWISYTNLWPETVIYVK